MPLYHQQLGVNRKVTPGQRSRENLKAHFWRGWGAPLLTLGGVRHSVEELEGRNYQRTSSGGDETRSFRPRSFRPRSFRRVGGETRGASVPAGSRQRGGVARRIPGLASRSSCAENGRELSRRRSMRFCVWARTRPAWSSTQDSLKVGLTMPQPPHTLLR